MTCRESCKGWGRGRVKAVLGVGLGLGCGSWAVAAPVVELGVGADRVVADAKAPSVVAVLRYEEGGSADQLLYQPPGYSGLPKEDIIRMGSKRSGGVAYDFELSFDPGTETLTWSLLNGKAYGEAFFAGKSDEGSNNTVSYSFPVKPTDGSGKAQALDFNLLQIALSAGADQEARVSDLSFKAGDGLGVSGELATSTSVKDGVSSQWVAAPRDVNLADHAWSVSGRVDLAMFGSKSASGVLGLEIAGWSGGVVGAAGVEVPAVAGDVIPQGPILNPVVPEPGTWAAGLTVVAAVGVWYRRRRQAGR